MSGSVSDAIKHLDITATETTVRLSSVQAREPGDHLPPWQPRPLTTRAAARGRRSFMRDAGAALTAVMAMAAAACVDPSVDLATTEAEVLNGTIVSPWGAGAPSYTRSIVEIDGCTGTVVGPQWVLSAKHCDFVPGHTVTSIRPTTTVSRTVDRVVIHPTLDVVLLHVSQAMPADVPLAAPYAGTEASLFGQSVTCYGYGAKAATLPDAAGVCPAGTWQPIGSGQCLTNSAELRSAVQTAADDGAGYFKTATNAAGQTILPGDSGGPCFQGTGLAGVNSGWHFDLSGGTQVSMPAYRMWLNRVLQPSVKADYDGDRKTDLAVWRPSTGTWYVRRSSNGTTTSVPSGQAGDQAVLGDYDGDGKTDFAVWRPSTGLWMVKRSSDGVDITQTWGQPGDVPVPGDYDSDGKTDYAVWRPSTATWYVLNSADGSWWSKPWGQPGDVPVPGDYDGDMRTDLAVWRPSTATWYVLNSANGSWWSKPWGQAGDVPASGDYDGDGLRDLAVVRPSDNKWYILPSHTNVGYSQLWGQAGDVRSPGDYDGDGKTDVSIFRAADHIWYVWPTDGSAYSQSGWGEAGDVSAPSLTF